MNFLAHSFLSCSDDNQLMGNIIADMVRNKELEILDAAIIRGIELHRKIDSFTDNHPAIKRCTKLLHDRHGKYASVIVDIFFDHLLFLNWDRYADTPFDTFRMMVYHQLRSNDTPLPEFAASRLQRMLDGDWLNGYTTIKGMNFVFGKVAERAKFDNNFASAMDDFERHRMALDSEFNSFFPEVVIMANEFCGC